MVAGRDPRDMCKVMCFLTWRLITLEQPSGVRMEPLCKAMHFLTWRLVMLERPAGGGGIVPWQYVKCKVLCFFCLNVDNAGMAHWWWEETLLVSEGYIFSHLEGNNAGMAHLWWEEILMVCDV